MRERAIRARTCGPDETELDRLVLLGFGSLRVADLPRKRIDRVNPRTARIVAELPVGGIPIRLRVGFGSVWVRDDSGRVLRIQPQS